MGKVVARITVQGTDLEAMRNEAIEKLSELHGGAWTVDEVDLWGSEDIASKAGMLRNWSGSFTCSTTLSS